MAQVSTKSKPRSSTLRGQIAKKILHSIFTGETVGGDRLIEEEVAAKLGVSRTPVREALGELAALGLIHLKPNHGAVVAPFGPQQLREIYQIRRVLESEAARHAAEHVDLGTLKRIRERTQQLLQDPARSADLSEELLDLDQKFHELIACSCGSERLCAEIRRYWTLARSIGEAVGNLSHTQDRSLAEHARVMDAIVVSNNEEAAQAMADHIDRGLEAALVALCR
jgi:DNA-binding GntR family transcriptional regulator